MKDYFYYMFTDIDPMNIKECEKQDNYYKQTFRLSLVIAFIVWGIVLVKQFV